MDALEAADFSQSRGKNRKDKLTKMAPMPAQCSGFSDSNGLL
jgi:hypothetical protein